MTNKTKQPVKTRYITKHAGKVKDFGKGLEKEYPPVETREWEEVARLFHDTYEKLALKYGYETREDTKEFDSDSPNGRLMIAVCKKVIKKVEDTTKKDMIEKIEKGLKMEEHKLHPHALLNRTVSMGLGYNKAVKEINKRVTDLLSSLNSKEE